MRNSLFREQAIAKRSNIWSSASYLPKGIPLWCVIIGCLVFIIVILSFTTLGSYNRRVPVTGEIISEPRAVSIFSINQGYVSRQFVHAGDKIYKGQTLYQLDTSKKTHSGVVSETQKENIMKQLSTIDDIINKTETSKKITIESLRKQLINYREIQNQFRRTTNKAEQGLNYMEKTIENYRSYLARGLINKEQLTNQMSVYYQRQNDMLNLRSQNSQFDVQIINLEANIKTQEADFDNRINQLIIQQNEIQRQLADTDANGSILISAPLAGHVESISVTPGEMVSSG